MTRTPHWWISPRLHRQLPVLGICYGAQLTAKQFRRKVANSNKREYGRAALHKKKEDTLLKEVNEQSQVWMSHADTILDLPDEFDVLATTENIPFAAFKMRGEPGDGMKSKAVSNGSGGNGSIPFIACNSIPKSIIP